MLILKTSESTENGCRGGSQGSFNSTYMRFCKEKVVPRLVYFWTSCPHFCSYLLQLEASKMVAVERLGTAGIPKTKINNSVFPKHKFLQHKYKFKGWNIQNIIQNKSRLTTRQSPMLKKKIPHQNFVSEKRCLCCYLA